MNAGILILLVLMMVILLFVCLLMLRMNAQQTSLQKQIAHDSMKNESMAALNSQASSKMFDQIASSMQSLQKSAGSSQSVLASLNESMNGINRVMANTKRRGSWGEYQMETLIRAYAGESTALYEPQCRLANGKIADGAFHLPDSDRILCIDSKFPMENYLNMVEEPEDEAFYAREFRKNMRKHIDDVASKYITEQTADQAILFIPSEAVYQYVLSEQPDLFEGALSRHVILCGPTTLSGIVFTLVCAMRDYNRSVHLKEIERDLLKLQDYMTDLEGKAARAAKNAQTLDTQMQGVISSMARANRQIEKMAGGKGDLAE